MASRHLLRVDPGPPVFGPELFWLPPRHRFVRLYGSNNAWSSQGTDNRRRKVEVTLDSLLRLRIEEIISGSLGMKVALGAKKISLRSALVDGHSVARKRIPFLEQGAVTGDSVRIQEPLGVADRLRAITGTPTQPAGSTVALPDRPLPCLRMHTIRFSEPKVS